MANLAVMHKRTGFKKKRIYSERNDNYMNKDATSNTIKYITRTRDNERRKNELVYHGSVNIDYDSSDEAIRKMQIIQKRFARKRERPQVRHEVVSISERDFYKMEEDFDNVIDAANEIGDIYDRKGYQEIHAIHDARGKDRDSPNKGIHIHYVINATGYKGGRRFSEKPKEFYDRRREVKEIIERHYTRPITSPIIFLDREH